MTVNIERMRQNLNAANGLIMAEAVVTALTPAIGRAAAKKAVARATDRAVAEGRPLSETLRDDPLLEPQLFHATLERIMDPTAYLGSAGAFVDRVAARVAHFNQEEDK